jgi:hypothetical protein
MMRGEPMAKTHKSTWKQRERQGAALFGAKRQVLSGSGGRDDRSRSDSTHPRLFVETKLRQRHATRVLWDATAALAKRESKTPVLILASKGRPGVLVCVHSDDLPVMLAEYQVTLENAGQAILDAMGGDAA